MPVVVSEIKMQQQQLRLEKISSTNRKKTICSILIKVVAH